MNAPTQFALQSAVVLCAFLSTLALAQATGRIAGTVRDLQGAAIVGADATVENPSNAKATQLT